MSELFGSAVSLAGPAAKCLTELMPTEAWPAVRDRLAELMGRGNASEEAALAEDLEQARNTGDPALAITGQLRMWLRSDPAAKHLLQAVLAEHRHVDAPRRSS
jgi:hypothetical protein